MVETKQIQEPTFMEEQPRNFLNGIGFPQQSSKGKRHTKQSKIQKLGQFYTTNVSDLLSGYEHLVSGKHLVDMFAGEGHLLEWVMKNGAKSTEGYDIEPKTFSWEQRDSIMNPPQVDGFLISNPPFLSKNKNKNKIPYEKWKMNDLYKCHLAALKRSGVTEGILILPSNFMSESSPIARNVFFQDYSIGKLKYFYYPVFPGVTTGIVVFDFFIGGGSKVSFDAEIYYPDKVIKEHLTLKKEYDYLWGGQFFDLIRDDKPIKITKHDESKNGSPNTNIIISLLTRGAYPLGAHYNEGPPIPCGKKAFTTYQVSVGIDLTEKQQRNIVAKYNIVLSFYMLGFHGLFMANYMGADQKIKSRTIAHGLLSWCIKQECGINKTNKAC